MILARYRLIFVLVGLSLALTSWGAGGPTLAAKPTKPSPGRGHNPGKGITKGSTTSTSTTGLTLVKAYTIPQGNAAHLVWSDDGSTVFLADEEGWMAATRINAADPTHPTVTATNKVEYYFWAVDQKQGLLVFHPSLGTGTVRLDPVTFQTVWQVSTGPSHEIATDGTRVFAPVGWANVYGIAYEDGTRRLYVASGTAASSPGGVYIFDVSQPTPVYLGKIAKPSWDIAVRGTRLWRQSGPTLETWDVSNPAAPTLLGSWTAPLVSGPGGTLVQNGFGNMAANRAGTRLYITFHPVTVPGGNQVLDWPAGIMLFDTSGPTPRPLTQQAWPVNAPYYMQPLAVALSPDEATLAVSYWAFGVRFYRVGNDAFTSLGMVATTGEGHDIYVDAQGILYVFANDDIQIVDPVTGAHIQDIPFGGYKVDGGWRPFRDGAIVVPGPAATILKLAGGGIQFQQTLAGFGSYTWSVAFDGTSYLYQGDEAGRIHVDQVSVAANGTYNVVEVGAVQVPAVGSGANPLLALALQGPTLWALGPNAGL